jgi:hypothetical protein
MYVGANFAPRRELFPYIGSRENLFKKLLSETWGQFKNM